MPTPIESHQSLAGLVARRRKNFKYEFTAVAMIGGLLGYFSSPWFENFLTHTPDGHAYSLFSWEGMHQTILAFLVVHGTLIWPMIFMPIFVVLRRRQDAKVAARIAIADEHARQARAEETKQRIKAARDLGLLKRK